jgi:hypothetical protein
VVENERNFAYTINHGSNQIESLRTRPPAQARQGWTPALPDLPEQVPARMAGEKERDEMKVEAKGFVTEKRYGDCGYSISRYWVDIVHEVDSRGVQASISGRIPMVVFTDSDGDKLFEDAMNKRKAVRVILEVDDK